MYFVFFHFQLSLCLIGILEDIGCTELTSFVQVKMALLLLATVNYNANSIEIHYSNITCPSVYVLSISLAFHT